jgi:hypothetical protein
MTNRYVYRFIILPLPTMADLELTREKADSSLYLTFLQSRAIHLLYFLAKLFMRNKLSAPAVHIPPYLTYVGNYMVADHLLG